jgi:hypothetical protein|tara:strand:+ start:472 stop:831 length:360 start_codon:yes stop_codon:yes gene_type:complete
MKILCFDLDNVICTTKGNRYLESKPKKKIINLINNLYKKGYVIKIFTARYMGKFDGNAKKAKKFGYKKTFKQLKNWKLNFHKLILGKPSYDLLIDDKALGFRKNWTKQFKKVINYNYNH